MENRSKTQVKGTILLTLTPIIWGLSFIAQSEGGTAGSFTFQASRCLLAFLTVFLYDFIRRRVHGESIVRVFKDDKRLLPAGLVCGAVLGLSVNLQQIGIDMLGQEVSTGRAGFLTALYIVIVPLLGIFRKKYPSVLSWVGVAIATVGLYLISIKPGAGFAILTPDILLLIGAVGFAVQISLVDELVKRHDAIAISWLQFFSAAVVSAIGILIFERPTVEGVKDSALMIAYSGILSGGVAFTFQNIGQKYVKPVVASLLMSLESVFTALFDWIIRGNTLSARELVGCVIVFAAVIIAQLPPIGKKAQSNKT